MLRSNLRKDMRLLSMNINHDKFIVYTDGACIHNGQKNAKAGIGIYFKDNDPRNISRRIKGKQTNNTAELSAVIEVFSILQNEISSNEDILIYSDSEYTIRCSGDYGEKCKKKQWKNKKGYIPNHELVKKVYECFLRQTLFNLCIKR